MLIPCVNCLVLRTGASLQVVGVAQDPIQVSCKRKLTYRGTLAASGVDHHDPTVDVGVDPRLSRGGAAKAPGYDALEHGVGPPLVPLETGQGAARVALQRSFANSRGLSRILNPTWQVSTPPSVPPLMPEQNMFSVSRPRIAGSSSHLAF